MARRCPNCQQQIDASAEVCPICGTPELRVPGRPGAVRGVESSPVDARSWDLDLESDPEIEVDAPRPLPQRAPAPIARFPIDLDPPSGPALAPLARPQRPAEISAARTRPQPTGRHPGWIVGAVIGVLAIGAVVVAIGLKSRQPAPATTDSLVAPSSGPAVGSLRSDSDFIFGGRSADWWANSLTALRGASDPAAAERYRVVKQRAEALGLLVIESAGGVAVRPSPELDRLIDRRLGQRTQ